MYQFFVSLSTVLGLLISLCPNGAIAEDASSSEVKEVYPVEFVRDYSTECVQTSMAEGLGEIEANNLCECTISEFQKLYSLQEFRELTAASATDETAENTLIEVGQLCFESILYEQ